MHSHKGCICVTFLQCVFSCVSSNDLHEMMHSHTGCICLTFLQCAFSCDSSNDLPEMMHSHNGCICLTFLQCVFSCVSSNDLHVMMHSYADCICLTILQLVFLTSKRQHEKMQSHSDCICLIWLSYSLDPCSCCYALFFNQLLFASCPSVTRVWFNLIQMRFLEFYIRRKVKMKVKFNMHITQLSSVSWLS